MTKIIKSSQHTIKFANIGKQLILNEFLAEYDRVLWWFVDYLWENKIIWGNNKVLDIKNNKFNVPNFISTINIDLVTDLSARAVKLAAGEALSVIKSRTEKRKKQYYILAKKMSKGDTSIKKLQSKIDSDPLTKPTKTQNNTVANLDSNCCKFIPNTLSKFNGWLKLSALGKKYGHIYIPIKFSKHSNQLAKKGYKMITSWQISNKTLFSKWEIEREKTSGNKILGADQGYVTCLSLSDGQTTGKDIHNHDLHSIINKLVRKKKGSNGFAKAQAHRTNYINWSINQLDLSDVKEIRLEKLYQMRKGSNMGRNLSHWTYTQINTQIISRCGDLGVPVILQSASYRSQRCSDCGWTQKSNRKGKEFICKQCGSIHDADINGALNHEADLYQLPIGFWQKKFNIKGFYWNETLVLTLSGAELIVPHVQNV